MTGMVSGWAQRVMCGMAMACFAMLTATTASALTVTVTAVDEVACDASASAVLSLSNLGETQSITSFGIDVGFDTNVLTFGNLTRGAAVTDWVLVSANVIAPGVVRIGGAAFNGTPITNASSAFDLFTLNFTRVCASTECTTTLSIVNLTANTTGAAIVNDDVLCGTVAEGEGVVEGEGVAEGVIDGEGTPEGVVDGEGVTEGAVDGEGAVEGSPEGTPEGSPEGNPEGSPEGTVEGEGSAEGSPEGVVEGEGEVVDLPPVAVCSDLTVDLVNGFAIVQAAQVGGASTDDVGIASLSLSKTSFSCSNVGPNEVTLTVTDTAQQTSTCTATITIRDQSVDFVTCKNFATTLDIEGKVSISVADIDNNSRDGCGIESKTISKTDFTCADVGTNEVTLTVTDKNGNVGTCTATVTIADVLFSCVTPTTFSLSVQSEGNGTVNVETAPNAPDGLTYTDGTSVTLTAVPAEGFSLMEWTGDTDGGQLVNNSITVVMNKNRAITAKFAEDDSNNFGCRCVAFEKSDPTKMIGEFFLGALTVMILLAMTAYQKRFW